MGTNPIVNKQVSFSEADNLPSSLSADPLDEPMDASSEEEDLPTLPDFIFDQIPDFFKRVVNRAASEEERDILLLGAMVTLGSCLTRISGIYDGITVFPNLYLYVTAKASAGKGRLSLCRRLVAPVHDEKKKQSVLEIKAYEARMRELNALQGKDSGLEKLMNPPVKMHIIPANISTSGFLQLLNDNDGQGLIIETEGDTLAHAFKMDYSNYSDVIRKGFHHEAISLFRKTDHEYVELEHPRFSMILSSTIGQMQNLIPSLENGLASRFLFYHMNLKPVWKDVFANNNLIPNSTYFNNLGQEFFSFYNSLNAKAPIDFSLTEGQKDEFNDFFSWIQDKYLVLQGLDYISIVRRLGLVAFRMMMILTVMRNHETGVYSEKQQCSDVDFQTVLAIIRVVVRHASYVISQLPSEVQVPKRQNRKQTFFDQLPEKFTNREFTELGKKISIPESTAKRYIAAFCDSGLINRETHGNYVKMMMETY